MHEFRRRKKAAVGMLPTDECLGADHRIILEADFRLVEEFELVPLQRARELCLEPRPDFEFYPDAALENDVAAASFRFCTVECEMRAAEHLVGRPAFLGEGGDADAGSN